MSTNKQFERAPFNQHKANAQTDRWLKSIGIQPQTINKKTLLEHQALRAADHLLAITDGTVTTEEIEMVKAFRTRSNNTQRGSNPTQKHCYQILNLLKTVKVRINKQLAVIKAKRESLRKKHTTA